MDKSVRTILPLMLCAILMVLSACNTTKYVPQDKYLLDKTKVNVEGTREVGAMYLNNYLRQKENSKILGFWRLQLHIYNTAPADTTTKANKRLAANAHKMGEEPVIYDETLTELSMSQLQQAMENKGFFNAEVDTSITYKDRKVAVTYNVKANAPYVVRDYHADFEHDELRRIANGRGRMIHNGDRFDVDVLDQERQRITSAMRRHGYYYFEKSFLAYVADSSYRTNEVAIEMSLQDYVKNLPDSISERLYRQYTISTVNFYMDYDPNYVTPDQQLITETEPGYTYSYTGHRLLRNRVLRKMCRIVPGEMFNEAMVEQTYANLNALGPVKYIDIAFEPVGEDQLDCQITISRNKLNNVSAELEGTYSAGDWGIAAGVGYINRNIFRGAEQLNLNARASYEWRQNGGRAIEAKAEAGLLFPNQLKINFAYNYQNRPDEYTRTIASAGLYYNLHNTTSKWTHTFNLLDISYVYLPWMSDQFRKDFIERSSVLKYSYEDHFIVDWSYRGSYTNFNPRRPNRSYVNFYFQVETAGNLLYAISRAAKLEQDATGKYVIFKIPYSQYAKGDINFSYHQYMAEQHQLVYHAGLGVAIPYLNAATIPFEKRYFAGGSNSVRGWQARTLGPGTFRGANNALVYDLQAGDIRLDLNLEYRYKPLSFLELAAFVDAGNIWTIRDYEQQPGGVFRWSEFYKQLAMSYGFGVRFDFSILVFRVDLGVKLHDPSRIADGTQWRTAPNGLRWRDDCTLHFAIGYPF